MVCSDFALFRRKTKEDLKIEYLGKKEKVYWINPLKVQTYKQHEPSLHKHGDVFKCENGEGPLKPGTKRVTDAGEQKIVEIYMRDMGFFRLCSMYSFGHTIADI